MSKFSRRLPVTASAGLVFVAVLAILVVIWAVWVKEIEPSGEYSASEGNHPLPGKGGTGASTEIPDKIAIRIGGDGQIYLNDLPIDSRTPGSLPELTKNLTQLKASCEAAQSPFLVTIYGSETGSRRVFDVLDSLGQARIAESTFQLIEEK